LNTISITYSSISTDRSNREV